MQRTIHPFANKAQRDLATRDQELNWTREKTRKKPKMLKEVEIEGEGSGKDFSLWQKKE